jgi:hypothetical protein
MSALPFKLQKKYNKYIENRIDKLTRHDEVRLMELLESIQYGLGYFFVGFILGVASDMVFPVYDSKKDVWAVFTEVFLQCIVLIVLVFYCRKIVKLMPFLFAFTPKYRVHESDEYHGEIMIAVILIGVQINLIKKLDFLSKNLFKWMWKKERVLTNEKLIT